MAQQQSDGDRQASKLGEGPTNDVGVGRKGRRVHGQARGRKEETVWQLSVCEDSAVDDWALRPIAGAGA